LDLIATFGYNLDPKSLFDEVAAILDARIKIFFNVGKIDGITY